MENSKKLCLSCMREYDGELDICDNCGKNVTHTTKPFLSPGYEIKNYIVGELSTVCGDCGVYIGLDKKTKTRVTIREFVPLKIIEENRSGGQIVPLKGYETIYKSIKLEFCDLYEKLERLNSEQCTVNILDMFEQNNTHYVVHKYHEGISLIDFIRSSKDVIDYDEIMDLFINFYYSVASVNSSMIVHRAISPSKIFITDQGESKLIDFSVAAAHTKNSEIEPELVNGYSAPEQHSLNGDQGGWTDVYGASATLYYLLTGVEPEDSVSRAMGVKLPDVYTINSAVTKSVSDVIKKGMSLNVNKRYKSMNEFVHDLEEKNIMTEPKKKPKKAGGSSDSKFKKIVRSIFRKRRLLSFLLALLVSFSIFLVLYLALGGMFKNATYGGESSSQSVSNIVDEGSGLTTVPNFIGALLIDFEGDPKYEDFVFEVTTETSENVSPGTVISQNPAEGTEVSKGTTIEIVVSEGPEDVAVPYVIGMKTDDAVKEFDKLNIRSQVVYMSVLEEYEIGTVYQTSLPAGTLVAELSDKVYIYVVNWVGTE